MKLFFQPLPIFTELVLELNNFQSMKDVIIIFEVVFKEFGETPKP